MLHDIRWTIGKIKNRIELIENLVYIQKAPIFPFHYKQVNKPVDLSEAVQDFEDSTWKLIQPFDYWATPRTNFILRSNFTIPSNWLEGDPVALYLPIGISGDFSHPEALVYIDGEPFAACDRHHQEIILPESIVDGKTHDLILLGWTGIGGVTTEDMTDRLKMGQCKVVQIHQPTRDFHVKARIALGITGWLDVNNPTKHHLLTSLDDAFRLLDIRTPIGNNFYASIPEAIKVLDLGLSKSGSSILVEISAIGHAHLDIAWLWTLEQSRQKARRTFYNVIRLMEKFPDFIFAQSQPQLYEYILQYFPELFEQIKSKVKDGQWEVLGGMWVEADCNLSGPESLVRQFLIGRGFFEHHFGKGVDSPVLWLPDVFGYAWNLPQLIKEAGLDYFFTIKIGWSQYNRLPYDSFWWQGLDGTRILTHFSTTKDPDSPHAATYNSDASPSQVMGTWMNFQQKDYGDPGIIPPLLMSFGYGDGGGGPTRQMIENIQELKNFPASPKVEFRKVSDFFMKLQAVSKKLPVWNGELYLEYHRGTYTTQARNKRANRKSEFLIHDAEFLATYAWLVSEDYSYPHELINKAWKLICLNQFHDIIPGSSISPVYEESLEQYKEINNIAEDVIREALEVLVIKMGFSRIIVNPTSFIREECLHYQGKTFEPITLPPYSIFKFTNNQKSSLKNTLSVSEKHLENKYIRLEINEIGDIIRVYDKIEDREILPPGTIANQFLAFEDIPLSWDAWDIDIYYDDKIWFSDRAKSIEVIDNTPFEVAVEVKRQILSSDYTQIISLSTNSSRIDFDTQINWQERQIMLKVSFPVDVLSPTATYEIQWGNVDRPTHQNTSWDWARFETAAQKWVDLSDGGYGVSLLNDCKYGHDVHENTIRLTLLRGTTDPDPTADLGVHEFKYSLLPHSGRWGIETVKEAYSLNDPLIHFSADSLLEDQSKKDLENYQKTNSLPSLVRVNKNNIIIETIKLAEDGNGIIVRLYDYQRKRVSFILETVFPIREAWRTNILEENKEKIQPSRKTFTYSINPYQILTFRIVPEFTPLQIK